MRFLSVRNILNCIEMNRLAKKSHYIFQEASGGVVYNKISTRLTAQNELTYLIRTFDLDTANFGSDTILLPLTTVLSSHFWASSDLLKSLNLTGDKNELLFQSLAEKLSDNTCTSLTESFMHFMAHQQNLCIAVEKGKVRALIYQDLHDTLFDTISFLLEQINSKGLADIEELYSELYDSAKVSDINLNNQMLFPGASRSGGDILAYYLRFYKYLSRYDFYFARLSPIKNLFGFMAERIYNDKRLDAIREQIIDDDALSANRKNLFWLIDRAHYLLEKQKIESLQLNLNFTELRKLTAEEVYFTLSKSRIICSRDFPLHLIDVETQKIESAYDLYNGRIIFVIYDGKPCLLISFQGVIF